jgi:hypothetical protein
MLQWFQTQTSLVMNPAPSERPESASKPEASSEWLDDLFARTQPATTQPAAPAAPPIPNPQAPPTYATQPHVIEGDNTGGVIPYKNPQALTAYYVGLFSLIPVFGLVMGPLAIWLGIKGLKYAKENPVVKGQVHAWIGIVCGTLWTIVNYGLLILFLGAFVFARN